MSPPGRVIGRVKDRRTWINFLRFMEAVVAAFPQRDLHLVLDNLNGHTNAAARRWLRPDPRVQFHPTPTLASQVNLIEVFFRILGKQGLAHRVDRSTASAPFYSILTSGRRGRAGGRRR